MAGSVNPTVSTNSKWLPHPHYLSIFPKYLLLILFLFRHNLHKAKYVDFKLLIIFPKFPFLPEYSKTWVWPTLPHRVPQEGDKQALGRSHQKQLKGLPRSPFNLSPSNPPKATRGPKGEWLFSIHLVTLHTKKNKASAAQSYSTPLTLPTPC